MDREKKINRFLFFVVLILLAGMVIVCVKRITEKPSPEHILEGYFEKFDLKEPEEWDVTYYDQTPYDFQGKCTRYFEVSVPEGDSFYEQINMENNDTIKRSFQDYLMMANYSAERSDSTFEDKTVIDASEFMAVSQVRWETRNVNQRIFLWISPEKKCVCILTDDG